MCLSEKIMKRTITNNKISAGIGKAIFPVTYGFRETSVKIDTTKKSWLILGDSVTMGIGAEADSTFAGILHSSLDSINILNPSIIGYNNIDYLNVYKYFVIEKKNDFKRCSG